MKKTFLLTLSFIIAHFSFSVSAAHAEDGSKLWLRYDTTLVKNLTLKIDASMPADDGYWNHGSYRSSEVYLQITYSPGQQYMNTKNLRYPCASSTIGTISTALSSAAMLARASFGTTSWR